jgi:hypothetical protein
LDIVRVVVEGKMTQHEADALFDFQAITSELWLYAKAQNTEGEERQKILCCLLFIGFETYKMPIRNVLLALINEWPLRSDFRPAAEFFQDTLKTPADKKKFHEELFQILRQEGLL